jgi:regulator of sigma E protease
VSIANTKILIFDFCILIYFMTAIVFIITLAILIFVHELGHFLVARRNKIKVEEFGFGFPPRIFGFQILDGEKSKTKKRFIWGKRDTEAELKHEEGVREGTIYSINWIPLGGFVKIKGEDGGHHNEEDSFSGKPAWVRIKVLGAGIIMNFVLAWAAISLALMVGSPQAIEDEQGGKDSKIQIAQVIPGSPAEKIGIKAGDQILKCTEGDEECQKPFSSVSEVQNYINKNKGREIALEIKRDDELLNIKGVPRVEYPEDQGALGISLVRTAIVSYPWYESIYRGLVSVLNLIWIMIETLFNIIKNLIIGQKVGLDVSGPVGIAYLTKQVTQLGFTYILQFVALLSINLGIINGFPFPALDGGRILFILIEKMKGSPVSQKVEQFAHTFGFIALIALMILVTLRDVVKFEIFDKLKNLFS